MSSRQQVIEEQAMLNIFGKTENLSKIQRLFAQVSQYLSKNVQKGHLSNKYLPNVLVDLDAAIEENMPNSTSPDYNRYIAMKATSYTMRSSVNYTANREYTEKALALLEPIKLTPEGIDPYLQAVYDMVLTMDKNSVNDALKYLNDGMTAIDAFEKTGQKCISHVDIFTGKSTEINWVNEHRYRLSEQLYHCHAALQNDDMLGKLIFPALQGIFRDESISLYIMKLRDLKPEEIVRRLVFPMVYLMKNRFYSQVNHLVSVLMFHLVKKGRTAESIVEISEIDFAKCMICFWYSWWAHEILRYTYNMVTKPWNFTNPIQSEMIRFDAVVEPGVETYENQFPVDVIASAKEWKKVVKKGKAWNQRTLDYLEKYKGSSNEILHGEQKYLELKTQLLHWEKQHIFK